MGRISENTFLLNVVLSSTIKTNNFYTTLCFLTLVCKSIRTICQTPILPSKATQGVRFPLLQATSGTENLQWRNVFKSNQVDSARSLRMETVSMQICTLSYMFAANTACILHTKASYML